MIKRFVLEVPKAPGGRLPVSIVSHDREALLGLLSGMITKPWPAGRVIYYDPAFRGGVDLMVDVDGSRGVPCVLRISRGGPWSAGQELSVARLVEEVRQLFATHSLKAKAGSDPMDAPVASKPEAKTGRAGASKPGSSHEQLVLL